MNSPFRPNLAFFERLALGLLFFTLPVTSFPFFPPTLGGNALVRPLSIYPLLALIAIGVLPTLWRIRLPKATLALMAFILIAAASTMAALLQSDDPIQGITPLERATRGLITLLVGAAFYITVSLLLRNGQEMRSALRWLYAGFGLALLWGSMQAAYLIRFSYPWFQTLSELQRYISMRRLFTTRISGMTYEPNWFASQIVVVLLPLLLASLLTGQTIFRRRWRMLTIETILLAWSIAILLFTYSRAGFGIAIALGLVSVFFIRESHPPGKQANLVEGRQGGRRLIYRLVEAGALLALLAGLIYFIGSRNEFFARIWKYWGRENYLHYLGFDARFIYWQTAFNVYRHSPWLGVGLGNFAFWFAESLPIVPLAKMPEVLRWITPGSSTRGLITSKILYVRLLAETGLLGTAAFLAFLIAVGGCIYYLWTAKRPEGRFWGSAGILGMTAILASAFSFDSFAIPNMWVILGLITAAANVYHDNPFQEPKAPSRVTFGQEIESREGKQEKFENIRRPTP